VSVSDALPRHLFAAILRGGPPQHRSAAPSATLLSATLFRIVLRHSDYSVPITIVIFPFRRVGGSKGLRVCAQSFSSVISGSCAWKLCRHNFHLEIRRLNFSSLLFSPDLDFSHNELWSQIIAFSNDEFLSQANTPSDSKSSSQVLFSPSIRHITLSVRFVVWFCDCQHHHTRHFPPFLQNVVANCRHLGELSSWQDLLLRRGWSHLLQLRRHGALVSSLP
jgi:hypothetical protein